MIIVKTRPTAQKVAFPRTACVKLDNTYTSHNKCRQISASDIWLITSPLRQMALITFTVHKIGHQTIVIANMLPDAVSLAVCIWSTHCDVTLFTQLSGISSEMT